jgi:protein-S-isoprenylcysteine O-methyltransferase Ste14
MTTCGGRLFRWRSFVPLALVPLVIAAQPEFFDIGGSHRFQSYWEIFCFGISTVGLALRVLTVGFVPAHTSGRNTKAQQAAVLNTTGAYSVVRHPLYLGNCLIWLGVALFLHTWWLVAIAMLAFCVYYARIMLAEEEFLKARFGPAFEAWASRTLAFVPKPGNWTSPTLRFSWRAGLARENSTLLGIVAAFAALDVICDLAAGQPPDLSEGWVWALGAAAMLYAVVRWTKKRHLLAVDGR